MVEGTTWILKEMLSKWILETDCSWVDVFPTALLRSRMTPLSDGPSPYKVVYGRPPPITKQVSTNLPHGRGDEISQQMEQLGKAINQVTKFVQERMSFPLGEQIHRVCAWGSGVVKGWKHNSLAPHRKGPYTVVLTSPTAVKAANVTPRIHHMRVKSTQIRRTPSGPHKGPH